MDQSDKYFDFACRLLARRDYFTEELRQKIIAKGATAEEAETTIEKLNRFNYLDDSKVLEKYISEIASKGKGINYLKQKLCEKGCSCIISSFNLTEFYPFEAECAAAEKAVSKIRECEDAKLVSKLVSRGFTFQVALIAVKRRKETDSQDY